MDKTNFYNEYDWVCGFTWSKILSGEAKTGDTQALCLRVFATKKSF